MNVYIETNFILELAFQQEHCNACEALLVLSEQQVCQLILPAYSLAEPHEKLKRQATIRKGLQQQLNNELVQLRRNSGNAGRIDSLTNITQFLIQSSVDDWQRFSAYRKRLLATAEIIPLTASILNQATDYENTFGSSQDAIVYTSVLHHLQQHKSDQSCFLNKNRKDFDDPVLREELDLLRCKLITNFDHGLHFVKNNT